MNREQFYKLAIAALAAGIFVACMPTRKAARNRSRASVTDSIFNGGSGFFKSILSQKDSLRIKVVYTRIDRDDKNRPHFSDFEWGTGPDVYFYPASTVKLPVAILALQRLNELAIPGLDRNSTFLTGVDGPGQTGVSVDSSAPGARPTIAHYIKKILLVSDNDAFNRLYEFLGPDYINSELHKRGYKEARIVHRLSTDMTPAQNRRTNPVQFLDSSGKPVYEQPAKESMMAVSTIPVRLGKGYVSGAGLVNEPFDFSLRNRISLKSLHHVLRAVLFPDDVPSAERFDLTASDYRFLQTFLSMRPGESKFPEYSPPFYYDNYVKLLFYGADTGAPQEGMRIFNKTGTAYGFLADVSYVADFKNGIEYMLSATIYCNSDGIFNDDHYDYDSIGRPFLKELGRLVHRYELQRHRDRPPDLSAFQINYGSQE